MVEGRENDLSRQADATEAVVNAYSIHPEHNIEVFSAGAQTVGELRDAAEQDMGVNRETLELARVGRMRILESQGQPPEEDQWLAFIDQQLAFTRRMQGHVMQLAETTEYSQQVEAVLRRQQEAIKDKYPVYYEPPEGFYNSRQMEHYQRAKGTVNVATQDFVSETGIAPVNVWTEFRPGHVKRTDFVFEYKKDEGSLEETWERQFRVQYSAGGKRMGRDGMQVNHDIPLLVSRRAARKTSNRVLTLDEAYPIFHNPVDEDVITPFITVSTITPDKVKKLLTMAAATKGWAAPQRIT